MPVSGNLTGRVDPRKLIAIGLVSTAVTMFWLVGIFRLLGVMLLVLLPLLLLMTRPHGRPVPGPEA